MEFLALTILAVFSIIGLAAIFFTTFGTLVILIGTAIYAALTQFSVVTGKTFLILAMLYACGEVLEYLFIVIGAKKFGASNAAAIGAIIGGIIGAIFGIPIVGVGPILGAFVGIFWGAFLVELIIQRDLIKSLKSGIGSILGRIGSIVIKFIIAIIMLTIIIRNIF